ncbi:MAG: hypothetical protein GY854_16450 [Deltaproteobacteria bacterium]|nr:hypothetical protein [Deltaproteobacteria bacterium]
MGTMNHLAGETASKLRGKRRLRANETRPYQKVKYVLLAAVLFAALCGSAVGGILDPICLATRGVSLTFLPWIQWVLGGAVNSAMNSNITTLQHGADGLYDAVGDMFMRRGVIVAGGFLISLLFIAVLVVNRFIPRFWYRGLCPLGALLGLTGRFGMLTLKKDEAACKGCGKCQLQNLPQQRHTHGPRRSRYRRIVDTGARTAYRLLRTHLHTLHAGLPNRRHPLGNRETENRR